MVQLVRSSSPHDAGGFGALSQQLAQALRGSRLTVVVAAAGAGQSALLDSVLPLLRRRAIDHSPGAGAADGVVVPFPDRRQQADAGAQHERIHTMAHWDDASMQALQRALDEGGPARGRRALADALTPGSLADHAERLGGARLLFVFDHFEELLEAGRVRVGHRRLIETWAAAVRSPQLRANFLVAVDERSWPWLHAVCVGLPRAHWSALRLHAPMGERVLEPMAVPQSAVPALGRRPAGITPRPGKGPTNAEFLQSLNQRVQRVAQAARDARARNDDFAASVPFMSAAQRPRAAPPPLPPAHEIEQKVEHQATAPAEAPPEVPTALPTQAGTDMSVAPVHNAAAVEPTPAQADAPEQAPSPAPALEPVTAPAPEPASASAAVFEGAPLAVEAPAPADRPWPLLLGLLALATGVAVGAWLLHAPADGPGASAAGTSGPLTPGQAPPAAVSGGAATPLPADPPAPVARATVAAPAPAAFAVLGLSPGSEHARIANEFVAAMPAEAAPPRVEPLALDADPVAWLQQAPGRLGIARLDALRAAPQNGPGAPLKVLTPLFAEPVLFIVRADSPLRTIRQLQGKRISVGPEQGDAVHTVREVLRRQLGAPPADTVALAPDAAIAELVAFGTLDAIAVVEAQPMAWWKSLDPAVARRLRVLTLNPAHPQDQRLLDSMGTPPLHVNLAGAQGGVALVPAVMSYLVASGDVDADAERLTAMAKALCTELPQLRQQGHPAWRDLRPRAQSDTGWPVMSAFRTTLSRCVR